MFKYPWTNFHEMNMGWIIQQIQEGIDGCVFVRPEEFPDAENPVQAALDAAQEKTKMVLLAGQYDIYTPITVHQGTAVIGINNAEIISHKQDYPGIVPCTTHIESDCVIYGVKFNGNRADGPSESKIPSDMQPGEAFALAPLLLMEGVGNVLIKNCKFTKYDSNRTTSQGNYLYSVIGAYNSQMITIDGCLMSDCMREGFTFTRCQGIKIKDCYMAMGTSSYTEIGLGRTNNVEISGCTIIKDENITTSVINAMGDYIDIHNCNITAWASNYGIDYGNEISNDFTAKGLYIHDNVLNCHISAATAYPVIHDDVVISNNVIIGENLKNGSAVVYVWGDQGVHITIKGNIFKAPIASPIVRAIRTQFYDAQVVIENNVFEIPGLYLTAKCDGILLIGNVFKTSAMYKAIASVQPEIIAVIGCRIDGVIGTSVSSSNLTVVCIGCDLNNHSFTNVTLDYSLSYVRP